MKRLFALSLLTMALVACDDDVVNVVPIVLDAPATLTSISLDGAVHLTWSDNANTNAPVDAFWEYRIYSTGYSLDDDLCDETWDLEGSTVFGTEFLAGSSNICDGCDWSARGMGGSAFAGSWSRCVCAGPGLGTEE